MIWKILQLKNSIFQTRDIIQLLQLGGVQSPTTNNYVSIASHHFLPDIPSLYVDQPVITTNGNELDLQTNA